MVANIVRFREVAHHSSAPFEDNPGKIGTYRSGRALWQPLQLLNWHRWMTPPRGPKTTVEVYRVADGVTKQDEVGHGEHSACAHIRTALEGRGGSVASTRSD